MKAAELSPPTDLALSSEEVRSIVIASNSRVAMLDFADFETDETGCIDASPRVLCWLDPTGGLSPERVLLEAVGLAIQQQPSIALVPAASVPAWIPKDLVTLLARPVRLVQTEWGDLVPVEAALVNLCQWCTSTLSMSRT